MKKFELINLEKACAMSEDELQNETKKRGEFLRDELGMDRIETANFISSLLNMGVAFNKIFEQKKSEKENK